MLSVYCLFAVFLLDGDCMCAHKTTVDCLGNLNPKELIVSEQTQDSLAFEARQLMLLYTGKFVRVCPAPHFYSMPRQEKPRIPLFLAPTEPLFYVCRRYLVFNHVAQHKITG